MHARGHHWQGPGGGQGPGRTGRPGGPFARFTEGGRARRGEAKLVILDALKDGPKHGYEIIRSLEERSGGRYTPSPGTVYPTLQFLEELGLIRSEQDGDRKVFHITDAGKAEVLAHANEIAAFWSRESAPHQSEISLTEVGWLQDELENLAKTVNGSLQAAVQNDDIEAIRAIRRSVEKCRDEIRSSVGRSNGSPEAHPENGANDAA